jgi:Probable taurine catabolism dioxygenase
MTTLNIEPISPALGAIVSGVRLADPLDDAAQRQIEQALLDHHVLFFRDQPLTPTLQANFAARFGDLHIHPIYPSSPEQREVIVLDTAVTDVRDNAIWHTDVTFLETPGTGRRAGRQTAAALRRRHPVGQRHRGIRGAVQAAATVARWPDRDP